MRFPAGTAAASGLALCHICHRVSDVVRARCHCCGTHLHLRNAHSLERTIALLITAVMLYIPANTLPIMHTYQFGQPDPATIIGGVLILIDMGSYPIAAVIFIASVMVPIAKMLAIAYLVVSVRRGGKISAQQRTVIYRMTEFVGKWSMVDVFVVAILVSLVRLEGLLTIEPGLAAAAFASVVVVTMLSAHAFDVRLIWDNCEVEEVATP
jgi:paraquat-inducible protein A